MARRLIRTVLLAGLLTVLLGVAAAATIEVRDFDDPQLARRYTTLTHQLRCPKCQNETIAASASPIAADMRERVAAMLEAGRSDREIQDFLVQRFGEYVLYRPRLSPRTWLLWGGPFLLVGLGGGILAWRVRRRTTPRALDAAERRRLDALLESEERS